MLFQTLVAIVVNFKCIKQRFQHVFLTKSEFESLGSDLLNESAKILYIEIEI